jgi:hypothetical protein
MAAASALVAEAMNLFAKNGASIGELSSIKKSLSELKTKEMDVDVSKWQVIMREEIAKLQANVENSPSVQNANSSLVQSLQTEIAKLKKQVKTGGASDAPPLPPASNGVNGPEAEALNRQIRQLKDEITQKDKKIAQQSSEIEAANARSGASANEQVSMLQTQMKKQKEEAAVTLAAREKELSRLADERVKEVEGRMEQEKDEMMDAMAQEVCGMRVCLSCRYMCVCECRYVFNIIR